VAKKFERKYSIEVPKLRLGENTEQFEIDSSFFTEFGNPDLSSGDIKVEARVQKYERHMDITFLFKGSIVLACDRCMEPFDKPLDFEQRVIYTYDEEEDFGTDEVIHVDEKNPFLYVGKDLYDFVALQIPIRNVPCDDGSVTCPDWVEPFFSEANNEPEDEAKDDEDIDPRWAALKKLKDQN